MAATSAPAGASRTRSQRITDAVLLQVLKLPQPATGYPVTRDLRIPTRHGVDLRS